ncbi:MAG: DUF2330 domain-containing protein [Archangiaceae bacterium]|nr:DUF2330 domain-containing protein [Archangiaceae bacterium]
MRALAACAVAVVSLHSLEAAACGCFAAPTVVDPVVQAGERIAFSVDGSKVTAYVQIQYTGSATSFAWLVPVPAVPEVKVGTDELFEVLDRNTRPQLSLLTTVAPGCGPSGPVFGCGAAASYAVNRGEGGGPAVGGNPLVLRDTAGPYDYAVLKADSKADLQQWLDDNRFFVPTTSDAALAPYVRPGAYFLALKLRPGQTAGDLRPIVLSYASTYPMIPLVLTSATAVPHMGVQVFVLSEHRSIPRNYHHVQLNPLKLDWATAANYGALVTAAVAEAPQKHAFVTEYAGSSEVVRGQLLVAAQYGAARFGVQSELGQQPTPAAFVGYLVSYAFAPPTADTGGAPLPAALLNLVEAQVPYPPHFAEHGVTREQFFADLTRYLSSESQSAHPDWYAEWPGAHYDGPALAASVFESYVQPIRDADAMLGAHPYLTRMFTTLSPEDMTEDPVFAFNASLPDVAAVKSATRVTGCNGVATTFSAEGYRVDDARLTQPRKDAMPAAAVVELLGEEGPAQTVSRYAPEADLMAMAGGQGCAVAEGAFFIGLAAVWLVVRRRKLA